MSSAAASHPRTRTVVACAVIAAAALVGCQLLVPPVIGLANNGDFERVMGPAGFQYVTEDRAEKYFSWIVTRFAFGTPGWYTTGLVTSEALLARAARAVSEPSASGGLFDLRVLGALHGLLLVAGIGLLVSATWPLPPAGRWTAAALLVFVFSDVGYVAPLNSFYSQAASLVFLLLTLGCLARAIAAPVPGRGLAVAFVALAALFVCSKPQEAVQGFLLAAFALRIAGGISGKRWARIAIPGAVLLCGLAVWCLRQTPSEIADVARYHKVFMELLPNSPTPEQDLRDLGLDPAWTTAIGKIAYPPSSPFQDPEFRGAFLRRFRYARLARFYVTHPARLAATLERGGREALRLRHPRFGNYERSAGFPAGAQTRSFGAWSGFRSSLPGHPLVWIGFLFGLNLAVVGATYRFASPSGRLAREGLLLLILMAATAFGVCVLSNAHGDLARHFYVFHALCDLVLIADAVWVASAVAPARSDAG